MKSYNIDKWFLVVTENAQEKERFRNLLNTPDRLLSPQPVTDPELAPAPLPAVPDPNPSPTPDPGPGPDPDPDPDPTPDPVGTPVAITQLTPSTLNNTAGTTHNFTVRINTAQPTPTVVTLVASDPAVLGVQASVTVPAGSRTATFLSSLLAAGASTLSASANGTTAVSNVSVSSQPTGSEVFSPLPQSGVAIPTFHNMGIYFNVSSAPPSSTQPWPGPKVWLRFRRADVSTWTEGQPLWYDARQSGTSLPYIYNCRGSVVNLQPNTKYVFEVGIGASYATANWSHHMTGTTWSEVFPEDGAPVTVPVGGQYVIDQGGSASAGYKVYDGGVGMNTRTGLETGTGDPVQANNSTSGVIWIKASYVILRRVKTRKGGLSAIYIAPNVANVVIEDCDLSDFAWAPRNIHGGVWAVHKTAGVVLAGNNSRIVLQRNKIYHPHRGSWTWDTAHPEGPVGVFIRNAGQQNVVRYNTIYADALGTGQPTEENAWFHDGIGGAENFSTLGSPGADSDIYGNRIQNCLDDSIEAEGGGRNVRVYENYIDHAFVPIATTITHFGPIYIFRNVINRNRRTYNISPDAGIRPPAFKNYGVTGGHGGGRKFYFHNTLLQMPGSEFNPDQQFPLGVGRGNEGSDSTSEMMQNTVSRNNIYHVWKSNQPSMTTGAGAGANNSFGNELYNGTVKLDTPLLDSVKGEPTYKAAHGWSSIPALGGGEGNYQLDVGSLGLNIGQVLANFNDASSRQPASGLPDAGAHESGAAPLEFGPTAG